MVSGKMRWGFGLSRRGWAVMSWVVLGKLRTKPHVMNALDTEALDLVGCCLCMCLSFAYSTFKFVHDSAENGTALSVTAIGRLNIDRDNYQLGFRSA